MEQVPRDLFVPQDSRHMAYLDLPLSIGEEQTISQPYIVAYMTQALRLTPLVIPVGTLSQQELVQARRTDEGLSLRVLGPCRFVPLLGAEAFPQP